MHAKVHIVKRKVCVVWQTNWKAYVTIRVVREHRPPRPIITSSIICKFASATTIQYMSGHFFNNYNVLELCQNMVLPSWSLIISSVCLLCASQLEIFYIMNIDLTKNIFYHNVLTVCTNIKCLNWYNIMKMAACY